MKKILLLAHDPGGFDVVYPTYLKLKKLGEQVLLSCVGPAGDLKSNFQCKEDEFFSKLKSLVYKKKVKGLVTGTSWGSKLEIEAIQFCKKHGVKTIAILDYWVGYAGRFRLEKEQFVYPDYYVVMDHLAYEEAIAEGVPKEILVPLGHPGLDSIIAKRQTIKEPSNNKLRILFLSQPISRVYGDEIGYTEYTALRDLESLGVPYNVKFHPKDDHVLRDLYKSKAASGVLTTLLAKADLIIGMSTMGMLHACILNKPTISYQPHLKGKDHGITNKLGLTPVFTTYEDFKKFVADFQKDPSILSVTPEKLEHFLWSDGKSSIRVAEFIKEVLS